MSDDQKSQVKKKFQSVRGMHDVLPETHDYYTVVKKAVRHRCRQAGFRRITTPVMEDIGVFERSLGQATDVIEKEMYRVNVGDHVYGLRPEATAGICRAYIQHGMSGWPQPVQLYNIEPHYRHDRPQKGRFREFRQYDVEVLGGRDPSLDAQLILLAQKICEDLMVHDRYPLQIHTLRTS